MSTTNSETLSHLNFAGGFPTSKDLAPSIVFIVAVSMGARLKFPL